MLLSRDDILKVDDKATELILVDDWGPKGQPGQVYIRLISAAERDQIEKLAQLMELDNYRAKCCLMFLSDGDGKPLLKRGDLTALGTKSGRALDQIHMAGVRFNHMGPKAVQDAEKNSETPPPDASD